MEYKEKQCVVCSDVYMPKGPCSKYCDGCSKEANRKVGRAAVKRWNIREGIFTGTGSGSTTGSGKDNHMFLHGQCVFRRWAKEKKLAGGCCEDCGKNLKDATHYEWVGHHKDHNRMNNTPENLALLCKRCHQIEHECWKAFEGVTTSGNT